jgi:hypothetical protein
MQAKKSLYPLAALLLAMPFTPVLAQSGSALDRVEVSGAAQARTDVSRACPQAQRTLEDGMANALSLDMLPGSYRVEFELQGDRVSSVRTPYAPHVYRKAIRQSVRAMECADAAAAKAPQRFAFILDVVPERVERESVAGSGRMVVALRPAD